VTQMMQPSAISIELRDLPPLLSVRDAAGKRLWPVASAQGDRADPAGGIDVDVLTDLLTPATLHIPPAATAPVELLMLHEAQHRARNLVSLIVSLAHQSLGSVADEPAVISFIDRLRSLDTVAQIGCEVDGDLCDLRLIAKRVTARLDDPVRPRIGIEGPDVVIAARWAHLLAIIVHELVANAVRHGALSVPEGRADLRWNITDTDANFHCLHLGWRERHGPPPARTTRSGFGTRVLRDLPGVSKRARSALNFAPTGVVYDLWLDLSRSEMRQAS
jgi:two-component sensor histidine kinase